MRSARGYPFVGRSGKLLRTTAQSVGIDLARVLYTNVLMWRPEGNRDPKPYEVDACSERLLNELVEADPRLIVTVGGISANALLRSKQGILKRHGAYREIEIDGKQYGVFPIIHPASVFRQPDLFLFLYHDLFKVQQILDGHPPVLEPDWDQYLLIDRQALFYALCDRIREQELVSIDIEATDLDYQKGHILCVGFSWKRGTAAVLDWQKLIVGQPDNLEMLPCGSAGRACRVPGRSVRQPISVGERSRAMVEDRHHVRSLHHQRDPGQPRSQAAGPSTDIGRLCTTTRLRMRCMRRARQARSRRRVKSRSRGRVDALGLTEDEDEEKETKAKTGDDRKEALDIPIEAWSVPELRQMVMKYCGADVDYTLRLAEDLTEEMEQEDVLGVHDRLLLPAGVHFAWLEEVGMKVDVEYHNRLGAEWQQAQDEICRRLFEISESWDWPGTPSGRPWWSSHVRLKRYLYDELRLRKMISSQTRW
jgi:uracil-DNA glycosylase family 4